MERLALDQPQIPKITLREAATAFACSVALMGAAPATANALTDQPQTPAPATDPNRTPFGEEGEVSRCAELGTARPGNLKGAYTSYARNNHIYGISASFKAVPGCDEEGSRKVKLYHVKKGTSIVTGKTGWTRNGESKIVKVGNGSKKVKTSVRAAHFCWGDGAMGNDKKRKTVGKVAADVIWTPKKGGKPVTKTYYGSPSKVCK